MLSSLAPILVAILVWWASTGLLIWLVGRGNTVRLTAAIGLTILMAGATFAVIELRDAHTAFGVYAGFFVGIAMWAWHEAMLLFGFIAGPRRTDCPPGLSGWDRFKVSAQTVIHHEILIAAHALLIFWLSTGGTNHVAAATFAVLWIMRLSAKMLIFFGAPNVSHHFLPMHLKYLSTYFNTRHRTQLFPVFLVLTSAIAFALLFKALTYESGSVDAISYLLLGTLALLAVFEHIALILPIPDQRLWSWATPKKATAETNTQKDTLEYGRI